MLHGYEIYIIFPTMKLSWAQMHLKAYQILFFNNVSWKITLISAIV